MGRPCEGGASDKNYLRLEHCYHENWWKKFDFKGGKLCRKNYFVAGLFRSHCNSLYCLEMAKLPRVRQWNVPGLRSRMSEPSLQASTAPKFTLWTVSPTFASAFHTSLALSVVLVNLELTVKTAKWRSSHSQIINVLLLHKLHNNKMCQAFD